MLLCFIINAMLLTVAVYLLWPVKILITMLEQDAVCRVQVYTELSYCVMACTSLVARSQYLSAVRKFGSIISIRLSVLTNHFHLQVSHNLSFYYRPRFIFIILDCSNSLFRFLTY
jgi:predicted nucleic acid-binding protein